MDRQRLHERCADYEKALNQLAKALKQPRDEYLRDSVIQRFEITYELAWKMLKLCLEAEGISVRTPRETLQEALQAGFITDGNAWSDLQKMRNLTSHTYDESLAEQVYDFVAQQGLALFQQLSHAVGQWQQKL
ncbi:MAG TPA: HI0074 family nucleotidyltransferase substrate-binding subunit [Pseudothauera hydrothermalis]|jgi:nucleotidyltransferase substrate binding protein (TIGR01987 family)|nr:HI0074 family nucleotidyltransferase substrate-binding subunit [Pseudothauera hydrothermalis]